MSASTKAPFASNAGDCLFPANAEFMERSVILGANLARMVRGWARRSNSRTDHCTKVVLKNCVPEPSPRTDI